MTHASCLTANREPLVLQSVNAHGRVAGRMLEMNVVQTFCNPLDANTEVVYTFPLPWGAVLLGLEAVLAGQTLSGQVVAKAQARHNYEDAVARGHSAVLLSVNKDGSHTVELGNLLARETCVIRLRYVQALSLAQGSLRLMLPTTLAPRYGNAVQDGGFDPHAAPQVSSTVAYPFGITLDIEGELAQARIHSPSHRLSQQLLSTPMSSNTSGESAGCDFIGERQGLTMRLTLASQAWLDRDLVVTFDALAHDSMGLAACDHLETNVGMGVVMAHFTPRLPDAQRSQRLPVCLKLLVDCSGSMSGDSIQSARSALLSILGGLDAGDRFSLSRFGSTVEHRCKALWKHAPTPLAAVRRWVQALQANLGGTEMNQAVLSTLALPIGQQTPCDVLLVTDGEIHAIDELLTTAQSSGHRFFVVGIGSAVAEGLLRQLAQRTGGSCEFVAPGEAVQPAILRLYHRLRSPLLGSLRVQWPDGIQPASLTGLPTYAFDGEDLTVFATIQSGAEPGSLLALQQPIRLLGKSQDAEAEQVLAEVTPAGLADHANTLARLTAHSRYVHQRQQVQDVDRCAAADEQLAALAQRYQLVTPDTSMVLVHERAEAERAHNMPELLQVKSMLQAGWGGTGSVHEPELRLYGRLPLHTLAYADTFSVSSVWRRSAATLAPDVLYFRSAFDAKPPAIPAFLRQTQDFDLPFDNELAAFEQVPPHHLTTAQDGSGMQTISPAGLAHWLSEHPPHQWPETYQGLAHIGLHARILEWLELGVAEGQSEREAQVVQAFLAVVQELVQRPPGEPFLWRMPRPGTETRALEIRSDILYVLLQADAADWPQAVWDYAETSPWELDEDFEIPPFPRLPPDGTRELTEFVLRSVDIKIQKLAGLGLRPHGNLLEYRQELEDQLAAGGPYAVRYNSGWF